MYPQESLGQKSIILLHLYGIRGMYMFIYSVQCPIFYNNNIIDFQGVPAPSKKHVSPHILQIRPRT